MYRTRSYSSKDLSILNDIHLTITHNKYGKFTVYCDETRQLLGYTSVEDKMEYDHRGNMLPEAQQPIINPTTIQPFIGIE
jgi:hypothetical protein